MLMFNFTDLNRILSDTSYWNNKSIATYAKLYMLSTIATYSNMNGLHGL